MTQPSLILEANGNNGRQAGSLLAYRETESNGVLPIEVPFTRASTGMELLSDGLWRDAAINMPRRYWDGTKYQWLLEPQRENICVRSYQAASWNGSSASGTDNTTTSPTGAVNASTVNLLTGGFWRTPLFSMSELTIYTMSVFVKNNGLSAGQTYKFYFNNNIGGGPCVVNGTVDIVNGTFVLGATTGTTNASVAIENFGNGWYRLILSFTTIAGRTSATAELGFDSINIASGSLYMWGAQFEAGGGATSPIVTSGARVTRSADLPILTSSDPIGQTEGVIYSEFKFTSGVTSGRVIGGICVTGLANRLVGTVASVDKIQVIGRYGGNTFFNTVSTIALVNGLNKIAIAYKSGDLALFINGVLANTSTDAFAFTQTLNQIYPWVNEIDGLPSVQTFGNEFRLYKTRLTNAECIELTT